MQIINQGIVIRSRLQEGESSCCFAHPCVTSKGRWIVGFRAAKNKTMLAGRAMLTLSDDQGATWSRPIEPFVNAPSLDGRAGCFRSISCTALPDGRLAALLSWIDISVPERQFFDDATESLVDMQLFMSLSEDEGVTWAKPWQIDPDCYRDMARPETGQLHVTGDGRWICQFELNKRYGADGPWVHKPVLAFSSDEGRTWGDCVLPAVDTTNRIFYWDQRPSVLDDDGTMLNAYWTFDRVASRYENIHASMSTDHGRTWSAVWDTGLPGQAAPPRLMADGRVVLVHVDRTAEPTITAAISSDGGKTFDHKNKLVIHRRSDVGKQETAEAKSQMGDAWNEMYKYSVGLPDTAQLADGKVLVTWYTGANSNQTDVAWAVIS